LLAADKRVVKRGGWNALGLSGVSIFVERSLHAVQERPSEQ